MKFNRLLVQFLCITFCFSCTEKEVTPRTYPRVQTLSVDNITPEGARFKGEITFASQAVEEHGFLWSVNSDPRPNYNSDVVNLGTANATGEYSARAERSLVAGTRYFVRAYLRVGDKTVLGNVVEFKSQGSKAPRILNLRPSSGFARDTVRISGENFSNRPDNVKIMFGDKPGVVIRASDTLLITQVPLTLATENSTVSVTIAGKTSESPEKFSLIPPQLKALSASVVSPGDTLTISGSNFSLEPQFLQVFLNSESCRIISHTREEIKVIVPLFTPTTNQVSLKVVSSPFAVIFPQQITYDSE